MALTLLLLSPYFSEMPTTPEAVEVGLALAENSASRVSLPAMPSALEVCRFWKAFTAASVALLYLPLDSPAR